MLSLPVQTNWFICVIAVAISSATIQYYLQFESELDDLCTQVLSAIFASRDIFKVIAGYVYERKITNHVMK